jgi:hypothetical protein
MRNRGKGNRDMCGWESISDVALSTAAELHVSTCFKAPKKLINQELGDMQKKGAIWVERSWEDVFEITRWLKTHENSVA